MNNFNYLLLIIFIILLIFNLYINYNINLEFFQQLPKADLGPIKFVDYHTEEELGRYPSNWDESELYKRDTALEPTIIKIRRGPRGYKGKGGTAGSPGKCEGIININSIVGDNLDIASDNFRILSDNVKFKNKLCFGDDNKACLDKALIDKIKYNKIIENERDDYKDKVSKGYYVLGTAKNLESTRANNAENEADDFKKKYDTCEALRTNTDKYVTRGQCDKELYDKETYWSDKYNPIEKQNYDRAAEILTLKEDLKSEIDKKSATRTPRMYYTAAEYDSKVDALFKCTENNQKLQESNNTFSTNWVEKGKAIYNHLSVREQNKYGEKLDEDDNSIIGPDNLYIKKDKCEWSIANNKNLYGRKVDDLVSYDTSTMIDPRWGLITPDNTSVENLYGKITNYNTGNPELYIRKDKCSYDIATDKLQYGRIGSNTNEYGQIGTNIGKYGKIGTRKNEYGKIGDYGIIQNGMGDDEGWNESYEYCRLGLCGKIGTTNNDFGLIGNQATNYIIRSEYNNKVDELNECLSKKDMSNLTSINSASTNNDLSIKGNNLEFDGNTVTFKNGLCIQPDGGERVCLTKGTIQQMNDDPSGKQGPPGTCIANASPPPPTGTL